MKEKILFFICTFVFFLNIQYNFFHLIPKNFFTDSGIEVSESLVTGKLLNTAQGSIMEDGGFTGVYVSENNQHLLYNHSKVSRDSHKKFLKNIVEPKSSYIPYQTQIGGQAMLYAVFQEMSPFKFATNYQIFQVFNALMLSMCLSGFLIWVKRKFNFQTAIIAAIILIFNYWLFLYGRSIWWCNWVYFLPFVYALHYFENKKQLGFKKYVLIMSFLFFIKFWFTGFEFITTFLLASAVPYLYYHFENTSSFYFKFIGQHFIITFIPLLLMISFLLFQFYWATGDFSKGVYHLLNAFSRRTSDGYTYSASMKKMIVFKKYHLDIIVRYFGNSFINPNMFEIKFPFLILFLSGFLSGVYLYVKNIERRLVCVTAFSFFAPLSWLVLFKEHAHIHTHIDFIVWYIPSILFLVVLLSLSSKIIYTNLVHKKKKL